MKKILVTAAAAMMLSGCQSVPHNPYSWQYAAGRETVCLETDAGTDVAFTIPLRQALADKGVTVVESASAGCTKRLAFSAQTGGWSGAEIRKAQSSSSVNTGSSSGSYGSGAYSGTLGYPTSSRRVSAGYPNYSSGRYHGGVDFPVPSGSPVHAAASGTVIIAKNLNYSYGHYLVIDHGNGLSTLYAHNTTLLVGVGSHVTKGQVIARSGSTGNSTGPHCHFEVRVNGTRVNPFNYL